MVVANAINLESMLLNAIVAGDVEKIKWIVKGVQCFRNAGISCLPNGEDNEVYMDAISILWKAGEV